MNIRYEYVKIFSVMKMEKRTAKIIVGKAGGTAGKGAKTYKISLPTKWVSELELNDKTAELRFDGEKIIISPVDSLSDFIKHKKDAKHKLMLFDFFDGNILCSKICADFTDKTISVENFTENIVKTAFGNNPIPEWSDFESFLEERCVPKSRSGIREYLETIGVESYEPLEIIKKTSGRMAEDNQWIKAEEV